MAKTDSLKASIKVKSSRELENGEADFKSRVEISLSLISLLVFNNPSIGIPKVFSNTVFVDKFLIVTAEIVLFCGLNETTFV